MNRQLTLYSPVGAVDIINLDDFIRQIPIQTVQGMNVRVPIMDSPMLTLANDAIEPTFREDTIVMNEYVTQFEIDRLDIKSNDNEFIKFANKEEARLKALKQDFIIMLCKKKPDFHMAGGELNIENMNEMANMYAEQMGQGNIKGIQMQLSKYQKFFSICSPDDFKHYCYEPQLLEMQDPMSPGYQYRMIVRGKLHCPFNEKWILAPFEKYTYLEEANECFINSGY